MIDSDLPVAGILTELRNALRRRHELVLEAPPGAGKTTLVPLALLDEPWLCENKIIVLEPRRLAARAAAQRMAELLGEGVGKTVGYRVRLDSKVSGQTRIEVITEGILTRMLQADPSLEGVGLLIFDEFHERSLDCDLGLALALQGRALFRDAHDPLRLLVMSATLDGAAVADVLGNAPVVRCRGRQYPVEIEYGSAAAAGDPIITPVVAALQKLLKDPHSGSVLVFLPGQAEIRRVAQSLTAPPDVVVAPLYGGLSLAQQRRAIEPATEGGRKVVLATNIAETSLTIEGITTVLDSGLVREPVYDPGSGMTRLQLRRISRAASVQRMGRAGRLGPGRCQRLWSEEQQQQLAPRATPEIVQADLTPLALQLLAWGVDDPAELAWLDSPPAGPYRAALAVLRGIGAVEQDRDGHWRLLEHGRHMAALPMHPRLAHMLLSGFRWGLGESACRLAALLSERDPVTGQGADINRRLAMLSGDAPRSGELGSWRKRIKRQADDYHRLCRDIDTDNSGGDIGERETCGLLLACAYPDRIARRRGPGDILYQLASGRSARLPGDDDLAASEWLAVAELGGRAGRAEDRIFLAAELAPSLFAGKLSHLVRTRESVEWDQQSERLVAERRKMLGRLRLSAERLQQVPAHTRIQALLEMITRRGLELLPWTGRCRQWQARVQLLRDVEGEKWPDVSDAALLASMGEWLAPWLDDVTRLDDIRALDLNTVLRGLLPWPLERELEEQAPPELEVPSGSRYRIDYSHKPPVLAVKLQEMFGCAAAPAIARGRVQLMLHLLSPAGRPLQVTRDLEGFWRNGYGEVRKEMKGRYPKHPWPEDPLNAQATRHTKRRGARDR